MNIKTLIFTIIGIFALSTISYFVISPIATDYLNKPIEDTYTEPETTNEDVVMEEEEKTNETKIVTEEPKTETTTTPEPTTTKEPQTTKPNGYTLSEVAKHSNSTSCWTVVNGGVYDLTSYIKRHPGGSKEIMRICGIDGTSAFKGQHGGESKPERTLTEYLIGPLIK